MEYFFYFNLALFIGSTLAILYGVYYLFFNKDDNITEGEFVINLILIIFLFFPLFISSYNLWDMKQSKRRFNKMVYYFYFNLILFIGSLLFIIYNFYLFSKKDEFEMTEGEFAMDLMLIICLFFPLYISLYNLWDMKQ